MFDRYLPVNLNGRKYLTRTHIYRYLGDQPTKYNIEAVNDISF